MGAGAVGGPRPTAAGVDPEQLLARAGSVEDASEHPIARAIATYARERGAMLVAPREFVNEPGLGARGVVDGAEVRVGRAGFAGAERADLGEAVARLAGAGHTLVHVGWSGTVRGVVAVAAPEAGAAYLGTQGDEWDAHKDMALAALGALITMTATLLVLLRLDPKTPAVLRESLTLPPDDKPLGEVGIDRLLRRKRRREARRRLRMRARRRGQAWTKASARSSPSTA